jgi:hypothetical protein
MQFSLPKLRLVLAVTSFAMACAFVQCVPAFAANVNLAWDPKSDPGLAGYKIYHGTSSRNYGTSINVGNVTTYSVTGLNSGTYYFAVTAYYTSGSQTGFSNEVSVTVNTATPTLPGFVCTLAFTENSGTTTSDSSGNSNTGTLSGASWTSQGKFDRALSFDGLNNAVTVNNSSSLVLSNGMTVEAWVYPVGALAGWKSVVRKEGEAYFLAASSTQGNVPAAGGHFGSVSNTQNVFAASPLPLNTWTHLAATYDGSVLTLFVNGNQVSNLTVGGPIRNDPLPLRIGNSQYTGEGFPGRIDEVRIYNRALTQSEIQNDMNTSIGGTSATSPLPAPTNVSVK